MAIGRAHMVLPPRHPDDIVDCSYDTVNGNTPQPSYSSRSPVCQRTDKTVRVDGGSQHLSSGQRTGHNYCRIIRERRRPGGDYNTRNIDNVVRMTAAARRHIPYV